MNIRSIVAGLGCVLFSAMACAGVGVWSGQGPYGGYVFDILQDPSTSTTLYVSTRSGIFKSVDAGASWTPAMNGIVGSVSYGYPLAIDADTSDKLYAVDSTGHVYRTTDGAANWLQTGYVLPPVATISQINQITDAPGSTTRVYLATVASGILASNDSGATFSAINGAPGTNLPAGVPFQIIAVDPTNPNNLLAGTAYDDVGPGSDVSSIYRSSDGGLSWTGVLITSPSSGETLYASVPEISFGHGAEVYALVDDPFVGNVVYVSPDGGATWSQISGNAALLGFPTTVKGDGSTANSLYVGGYFGLKHSADGGAVFGDVATATNGLSPNGFDVATASRLLRSGSNWFVATQEAGLFKSTDSGASWNPSNSGIEATNIRALGMVPVTASAPQMLAGYGDAFRPSPGIYAGFDAGDGSMTWANSNSGLRAYQIRAITVDQTTANGVPGSTVVYSGGRSEQAVAIAPRNGGIYKSGDGGSTWTTIDSGLPLRTAPQPNPPAPFIGTVRSIALDPHSCTSYPSCSGPLNTVYATANGCYVYTSVISGTGTQLGYCGNPLNTQYGGAYQFRVFKSTNGGTLWSNSDSGIPQSYVGTSPNYADYETLLVVPLVIDPVNPNILYAGTSDLFDPTQVANPTLQTGIYKSTDSGATWTQASTGLPTYPGSPTVLGVLTLAIHPTNPQILWASVIDVNSSSGAPGHIYKTIDGGGTWTDSSVGMTSADIRALLVDPVDPNTLYAAGGGTSGNPGGVFKSYDGGATWHSVSVGLPADAALALALDPGDHNKLYAGTSSGVWEMTQATDSDFDGVSDIQEDLGPNNGDSNLDTIKDKFQPDVTYVPPHVSALAPTQHAPLATAAPNNDFAVQVAPQPGSTCVQVQDVQAKSASANGPDPLASNTISSLEYSYDVDLLQFEILNCAQTTVNVTYPNFAFGPGWSFRFYGPATPGEDSSIRWYDFSPSAVKLDAHSWQLTLTRGAFGSYRPAVTGAILFQGGPAYSDRVFANGFN